MPVCPDGQGTFPLKIFVSPFNNYENLYRKCYMYAGSDLFEIIISNIMNIN